MKGKFYGIGVGPGDPSLITLKAVELIGRADVIVCPESKKDEGSIALKIAEKHIRPGTEMLTLVFPMTPDREVLEASWRANAIRIHEETEKGKTLVFLTNNTTLPALTIAALYKSRWQVELFFKWMKQHLRIKKFLGNSENAVKTQIWIAVCTYVLIAIAKKRLHLPHSLYEILQILSLTMFETTPINQLLTPPSTDSAADFEPQQLVLL